MNKFEQLIEFVINDDEKNAKALFHEIVVEKSKDIYEEIMSEESEAEKDDHAEKAGEKVTKDIEYDDKMDESIEESDLGGSQVDDLIDEVEAEEEGVRMEDDDEEIEMIDVDVDDDDDDDEDLEDRVVDIEDKLDELMGEFEELMAQVDDNTDDIEVDNDESLEESPAGDALQIAYDKVYDFVGKYDDAALEYLDDNAPIFQQMFDKYDGELDVMASKLDADTLNQVMDELNDVAFDLKSGVLESKAEGLEEGVELVAAPKPVTTSPASKSPVAANSGQKGMDAKPVNIDAGNKGAQGRATPKYGDMNATTKPDVKPATKPQLAQASGVNTKSVID